MIFFECYADEALLRFLGFNNKELRGGHSFGRSNVCGKLYKSNNSLGLIDEDPGATKDPYLKKLTSIPFAFSHSHLSVAIDKATKNLLLILRPDLEGLVLKIADEKNTQLSSFSLPETKDELHDLLRLQKNVKLREKLIDFLRSSNHEALSKMQEVISTYLKR